MHCTEIVLFQPDFPLSLNGFMDLFSRCNEILNLDEKELVQQTGNENKTWVCCLYEVFSKNFIILRRTERDIILNVHTYLCTVPFILVRF